MLIHAINFTVCLGTYAQIHQTVYTFSAEWEWSHSWHSCKKRATLTGGLRLIGSDCQLYMVQRSRSLALACSHFQGLLCTCNVDRLGGLQTVSSKFVPKLLPRAMPVALI